MSPTWPLTRLALGFALALAIAWLAHRRGSLAGSGVGGACLVGGLVFGLGGWAPGLALVAFFVSSSALGRWQAGRKAAAEAMYAKGGRRDLGQVLANGGVAAALAVWAWRGADPLLWAACLGALAAAAADTWATEVGPAGKAHPRLITTWRRVAPGTSGAVSALGLGAALAGAALVAAVAAGVWQLSGTAPWLPGQGVAFALAVVMGGVGGSLVDSLLGATVQGIGWCPGCGVETEQRVHRCGRRAELRRGWAWLGNDLVNLAATGGGAWLAAIFWRAWL